MSTATFRSPEQLIDDLGIERPDDIDVEVIAFSCGATVIYEPLIGSEAYIIGREDSAIITVNASSGRARQRFSAAHELGHWMRDRRTVSYSCDERKMRDDPIRRRDDPERLANAYAADLLLPERMFAPLAKDQEATFVTVGRLADQFQTSLTATAIRLVRSGSVPSVLIWRQPGNRGWVIPDADVPLRQLQLREEPGADSIARTLLEGGDAPVTTADVYADTWFEHERADRFSICESSRKIRDGVLTLLWWKDESQLQDLGEDEE